MMSLWEIENKSNNNILHLEITLKYKIQIIQISSSMKSRQRSQNICKETSDCSGLSSTCAKTKTN